MIRGYTLHTVDNGRVNTLTLKRGAPEENRVSTRWNPARAYLKLTALCGMCGGVIWGWAVSFLWSRPLWPTYPFSQVISTWCQQLSSGDTPCCWHPTSCGLHHNLAFVLNASCTSTWDLYGENGTLHCSPSQAPAKLLVQVPLTSKLFWDFAFCNSAKQ